MNRILTTAVAAAAACVALCAAAAAPAKPYAWPDLPTPDVIQGKMKIKAPSGLVVLQKRCDLDIRSYFAAPEGVRRDEFVRLLVANEEGVRHCSITVNDSALAKIEVIEGRTVAPDGTVTTADPKADIHKVEAKLLKDDDPVAGVATVNFPAPAVGAVLDLHFVTYREGATSFLIEPIGYEDSPILDASFTLHINGGLPGLQWSILILGDEGAKSRITTKDAHTVEVGINPFLSKKAEPNSVPYYRRQSTLLCYINYASRESVKDAGVAQRAYSVDPRGVLANFAWAKGDAFHKWWVDYFEEDQRNNKEFLKHDGRAGDINVESVAPSSLPLEERLKKLYDYVQRTLVYDPKAEDVTTLGALLKRGQNGDWQGTLFYSYLLDKARIPNRPCFLISRYYLQFSPIITNTNLYGFEQGVMVDVPGKGPSFFCPGNLGLPFGALSEGAQNSLAIWMDGKGDLQSAPTPINPPGTDTIVYDCQGELLPSGTLKGTLSLAQTGTPGRSFRWWLLSRKYDKEHPDKKDKTTPEEKRKAEQERMEKEFELPGTKAVLSEFVPGDLPAGADEPVTVRCALQEDGLAQPLQDRWLVSVNPLVAGYASPFTSDERKTPIWYNTGGHVTLRTLVLLPEGSKILELPKAESYDGPDRTRVSFAAEAVQKDGRTAIRSVLEYDQPYIVGFDRYRAWQLYQGFLAKLGESRCVVSMPAQGGLE
jgi:hypothetical protein